LAIINLKNEKMNKIKILSIFFLSLAFAFTSCEDSKDELDIDYNTNTEGVITTLAGTSGKLLGNAINPSDLENSEVVLTDANAELSIKLSIQSGSFAKNVRKYEIVKTFNGKNEVAIAETPTLPYTISYNSVAEYLNGFDLNYSDLRIGDQITFRIKVYTTSGEVYYQEGLPMSRYDVTVNCASDLAGAYRLVVKRNNGADVIFENEIISEVKAGYYKTTSTYRWDVGSIAPDLGFNFNDVCGTLNAPEQGLAQGFYSNKVYSYKDGISDLTEGKLVIYYIVEFESGPVENIATYTKL